MDEKFSDKVYSVVGSILFHIALLAILLYFGLTSTPKEEEGILVNFGDSNTGLGAYEPVRNMPSASVQQPIPQPTQRPVSPPVKSEPQPKVENNLTQDLEKTAALEAEKKAKQEAEKKRVEAERKAKEEAERIRIAEEQRIAAEKAEQARLAEEQRKKEEAQQKLAADIKSKTSGAFSKTDGTGTSEGVTSGTGNQGSLTGDPNSTNREGSGLGDTGVSFSLSGRKVNGVLPQPIYNIQESGVVVVEITVDKTGTVTEATPILKGTTTQNQRLWAEAKKAALKAKFNNDPSAAAYQKGTITYRFILD